MRIISDGWKFVLTPLILGGILILLWNPVSVGVGAVCLVLAAFCAYFFRYRDRIPPEDTDVIVAPGDGRVLEVLNIDGEGYGAGKVVRIFLSIFDGHVQYFPVSGKVLSVAYNPGKFLDARNPDAAFVNESSSVLFEAKRGRVMAKQIAGMIARRVVCWVKEGDSVNIGEKYGLIRFGSQVDIYMPVDAEICVKEKDKVVAGETVVGRWAKKQ